ncbi:helix-turn-helix transcriptional regulator [Pseudomonas abietaniphila]|jgi:transcriptional regulator with XRE-family HTH domain|uniref:helix-turn-helix domain-containing protein n=1 Tax=Pseudomonas abietaniphila TaxID=89065 RepID=UPI003217FF28
MSIFSKRLRDARTAAGLSQEQLGIESGIDPASASARMNQYENNRHRPNPVTIMQIAAVLKVPPAYFYSVDDEEAQLLLLFYRLDPPGKKQILALAIELRSIESALKH